jgi:predicted alpha-1,2-mannosidase
MKFHKLLVFSILLSICACKQNKEENIKIQNPKTIDLAALVYPELDTENSRWFFFSSASRPFGMVNLFPDTELNGAWSSGYQHDIDTIKGFSHIHGWQISGVSVMPVTVEDSQNDYFTDYYSKFSHDKEVIQVGYHKVELERYGIITELTSTKRVGFHQYQFPKDKKSAIVFKMEGQLGPCEIKDGSLVKIDDHTIEGQITDAPTNRRPKDFKIFFRATFNQKIESIESIESSDNKIIHFGNGLTEPLKMKVSISYTSHENAKLNMEQELNHWNFQQVVEESKKEWNDLLGRILIKGGSEKDQRRFYTDLWHALLGRKTISDVNGAYPDNTGKVFRVGQLPLNEGGKPKFNHYNSDAFYGTHWTINTLWGLVYPEIHEEFVNSLLVYYQDGGLIPRGPSGGNYTHVMTGSCMTSFIVSAYQKGIRGFDYEKAYEGLRKNHMPGGMMGHSGYEHDSAKGGGIEHYMDKGYVPFPLPEGKFGNQQMGAGMTLEYAYQDWVLAQFAKALHKEKDYDYFMKRSQNYKNLYDSETGWIRPKDVHGNWRTPFDPYEYNAGLIESNAAQFTWSVPHDLDGLAQLMGGNEIAAKRLNEQFEQAAKLGFTSGTSHEVETHPEYRRIPINYGNQESMQTAFIFNYLNRPDLTQYWSRRISREVHSELSTARGYNGDEDQGLMGALSVNMKIGLFQMNGGTEANPAYELGSPVFDEVRIKLNPDYYSNENFVIKTINNSPENYRIKRKTLNGKPIDGFKIYHQDIIKGGELLLEMSGRN